jgi:hypothetical protein
LGAAGCFEPPLEGRRCASERDCLDGFLCAEGVCARPEEENDAGVLPADDAGTDAGSDGGAVDSGAGDSGAGDGGSVDGGRRDAGLNDGRDAGPSDGGSDAGNTVASPDAGDDAGMCDGDLQFDTVDVLVTGCVADGEVCPTTLVIPVAPGVFDLSGSLVARTIVVGAGVTLSPTTYDGADGGQLVLDARCGSITVEEGAHVSADGRGFGGGGGGGGRIYNVAEPPCGGDGGVTAPGGDVGGALDGQAGAGPGDDHRADPPTSCANAGGRGGGLGGEVGQPGGWVGVGLNRAGAGGAGGGPFGGAGGVSLVSGNGQCTSAPVFDCTRPEAGGEDGAPGGYRAPGTNGEANLPADGQVVRGSGGGGGGGGWGSGSWCCGGGVGGAGGLSSSEYRAGVVDFNMTYHACSCSSGGGGAGGAAGGGVVRMDARELRIDGVITANGGGDAQLGAGYGAGGGIWLGARDSLRLGLASRVESLGGDSGDAGTMTNGGSIKVTAPFIILEDAEPATAHLRGGFVVVSTQ